ncbi:extracellular solute-binding protein [Caldilinea sp.]|jgi:multiple sugar transport system substrate-binding protein|uniref:ABC transporter substrate-binding protein n=1 Tax=Caldilinea sp. TaxID=2293560 RepID=UPI001B29A04B|nr:extracellular solute-binding protein [Caldilinea sp.]MBO9394042.1 extracellular solute-binding protein [Caldilinea sp.]
MRWTRVLISLLLLVGALALAACGTQLVQDTGSTAAQQAEALAEPKAEDAAASAAEPKLAPCNVASPASPTLINVIGWAFPVTEFYAQEFKECNQVENLKVNVQLLDSASAQEQVRLALSGGGTSPFAVVHAANTQIIEWGFAGWLMPLNDLIDQYRDKYDLDDIPQTAWNAATIDGNIYGIPAVGNTLHLMYRSDLFEKYNLAVPTTYDEVIAACEVLKEEPSIDLPFTMNLHAGWAWEIEFFHFLHALGGKYLNADNTPAFNGPEGVAALEKMKEVVDACMGPEGITYSVDDSEIGMETGRLAFVELWASRAANMDNPEKSDYVGQIGFAPAPAVQPGGPLASSAWNDFYAIPATTDVDPEIIFQVILEVTDLESQIEAAQYGIVTRQAVAESGAGGRYLPAAIETIARGVGAYPPNRAIPLVRTALGNWLPLVGTGELSPQEALDKAVEEYTAEATARGFLR